MCLASIVIKVFVPRGITIVSASFRRNRCCSRREHYWQRSRPPDPRTMYTLGINAAFHDSSACLVHDGTVIAAAEEERFTRIKHGKRPVPFSAYELPFHAIHYCLEEADLTLNEVDHVAY